MARRQGPDPGLPIKLEPCSNGEFVPPPVTPLVAEVIRRSNEAVDRKARRLGMSRRAFLRSAMGAATPLSVLAACSRQDGQNGGRFLDESTTSTSGAGGDDLVADTTTTMDEEAAAEAIGPLDEEFIFDVQGHLLELPPNSGAAPSFPQSACGEDDPGRCYSIEHFLELVFLDSDTHVAMLSAIPFGGGALAPEVMARTIEAADNLGCTGRVLMQGEAFPTASTGHGGLPGLEAMALVASEFPIRAFKTYTHAGGPSWRLDDDTGDAFLAQAQAVGVPIVAVHKGLSGNDPASSPVDIGPAALRHPDIDLVVYHSGYEAGLTEGPYDPASPSSGVDRLVASVEQAGIGPGGNVYAELGSTWRSVMGRPDEAAHLLGKLLVAVGEDNIVWGTDSIWYGSPQDQIMAFRTFTISEEFQERFGYPALTPEIKRKIFGHNAARLHGIDPVTAPCDFDRSALTELGLERAAAGLTTNRTHTAAGTARVAAGLAP